MGSLGVRPRSGLAAIWAPVWLLALAAVASKVAAAAEIGENQAPSSPPRRLSAVFAGTLKLCSVFALKGGHPCGNTASHLQAGAMVKHINSITDGLGFHVLGDDAGNPSYYNFSYEYETYPFDEWATSGISKSNALFPTCDVIVGQGHGCSDTEIQAQAAIAHDHKRLYFTLRGPRSVLSDPADPSRRLSPYMFSTHIRSDFYAHAMLKKFVQRSREIEAAPVHRMVDIAVLNFAHNAFFDGVAEQALAYARDSNNGYNLVYNANLKGEVCTAQNDEGKDIPGDKGAAGCTPLSRYLDDVASKNPEVLLVSSNGDSMKPVFVGLSDRRPRVDEGEVKSSGVGLRALFWVGVPWMSNGVPACAGIGSHCSHAVGATQISKEEADTFVDSLLTAGRKPATYDWLRDNDEDLAEAYRTTVTKAEADAAVIPSIIAQAFQKVFHDRMPASRETPLRAKGSADYEALRAFLASGQEVAQTFYGPVGFDAFGNNNGREATAFQMSALTGKAEITHPQSAEGAVTLRYYAPAFDEARKGTDAWGLDYGKTCDSLASILKPCETCLMCAPQTYTADEPQTLPWHIVLPVAITAFVLMVLAIVLTALYARNKAQIVRRAEIARVLVSVLSMTAMQHSAAFLTAEDFTQMGTLQSYERLRDDRKLRYCDNLDDYLTLAQGGYFVIFISHQWTSWTQPDHTNMQYQAMCTAVLHVAENMFWPIEKTLVWVDYSSIPQANSAQQHEAINALPAYVAGASVLLVVAPEVEHEMTGLPVNLETYRNRMWVRLEHLSFTMTNRADNMWVSIGAKVSECNRMTADREWLKENLYVFEAEATNESDKLQVVTPLLGLYAQLLVEANHKKAKNQGPRPSEDDKNGKVVVVGSEDQENAHDQTADMFFELMSNRQRPLFPQKVTINYTFKNGKRVRVNNPKPQELFGKLPELTRAIVLSQLPDAKQVGPTGINTADLQQHEIEAISSLMFVTDKRMRTRAVREGALRTM